MYKKRWIFCVIIILIIVCILLEIIWAVLKNRQAGNGKEIRITSCKELPEDLEEKKVSQSI